MVIWSMPLELKKQKKSLTIKTIRIKMQMLLLLKPFTFVFIEFMEFLQNIFSLKIVLMSLKTKEKKFCSQNLTGGIALIT